MYINCIHIEFKKSLKPQMNVERERERAGVKERQENEAYK